MELVSDQCEASVKADHKWRLNVPMTVIVLVGHLMALYGVYTALTTARIATMVWMFVLIQFGATGIIAGAHRLWTHRTYKAHWSLRVFLMLCQTLAYQVGPENFIACKMT